MARVEPAVPGAWWGRERHSQSASSPWVQILISDNGEGGLGFLWNGRWLTPAAFEWLGSVHPADRRITLPANATVKDTAWPRPEKQSAPTGALPSDGVANPERFGGYASPRRQRAGETEISVGGLTVWDRYVMAAIPAVIARVDQRDPDQWALVGATAAMVADLALVERKKREKLDEAR